MSLKDQKNYDVLILGSGVSGLSTAYHLSKENSCEVALISAKAEKKEQSSFCHMTMGGFFDNITRLEHQWGEAKARDLWKFSQDAYNYGHTLSSELGVSHKVGARFRMALSLEEEKEISEAIRLLKRNSFYSSKEKSIKGICSKTVIAIQKEGLQGGWISRDELLEKLEVEIKDKVTRLYDLVTSVKKHKDFVEVELESGERIHSKMLVLCCHQKINQLFPDMRYLLIPYQDESHLVSFSSNKNNFNGTTFSSYHGHVWGSFLSENFVQFGGARFLRKEAGVGFEEASFHPKIKSFLLNEFKSYFPSFTSVKIEKSFCGIEFRPQDELPLIGPVLSEENILMASGFMGQGLTLGLKAGKILSKFILQGEISDTEKLFLPTRFRKF